MIEIERYVANPEKPGFLQYERRATIDEVATACREALQQCGLLDELESFSVMVGIQPDTEWPSARWVAVFPVRGGSEGHYIHVEAIALASKSGRQTDERQLLILAKTFAGVDKASAVCAVLNRELHGD